LHLQTEFVRELFLEALDLALQFADLVVLPFPGPGSATSAASADFRRFVPQDDQLFLLVLHMGFEGLVLPGDLRVWGSEV
jgi:hypothetical protein